MSMLSLAHEQTQFERQPVLRALAILSPLGRESHCMLRKKWFLKGNGNTYSKKENALPLSPREEKEEESLKITHRRR